MAVVGSEAQFAQKSVKLLKFVMTELVLKLHVCAAEQTLAGLSLEWLFSEWLIVFVKRSGKPGCELKCGLADQLGASISFKMAWESSTAEKQGPCSTCSLQG